MNQQIFAIGDLHIPYHDPKLIRNLLRSIKQEKPQYIVLLGDVLDFYALSRFRKDPTKLLSLNQELEETVDFLQLLRQAQPEARIYYCEGNHEARLLKFLWDAAPQLTSLNLNMQSLLQLNRLQIHYISDRKGVDIGPYTFMHGCYVRKHPGASVLEHVHRMGKNIVIGHCHRLAVVHVSIGNRQLVGVETGCLTRPEYHDYIRTPDPNWSFGYVVLSTRGSKIDLRSL